MSSILVTIPARAGSKGIPNKNLREIGGKPIYQLAYDIGMQFGETVITTDIKQIYLYFPAKHRVRPDELRTDTALAWDVWGDAVIAAELMYGKTWDIHLYLEPTSPCRTTEDIQKCIDLIESGCDSVCTMSKAPNPEKFIQLSDKGIVTMDFDGFMNNKPRQLYPNNWYMKNGICYACTDKRMKEAKTMLDPATHFLFIKREVVNIDTELDLKIAEQLINNQSNESNRSEESVLP